ncbi:paraslipin [Cyanobacteria bacterium FACHB-DQ100]|uniref:SPFH domain-containing protein n=1 Tax=unclassified Leptolyngbya TaxID=2650499 RepID=UPI001681B1ED|nr:paraslipin [Leptolyngbya sp. FACHB-17]MBD1825393.1 paraslipin [Cyanobacteria bacterium FACHB-DQ100]MBD2081458.1 paraslipin [Leptolyngbya sp. FACHB-17]
MLEIIGAFCLILLGGVIGSIRVIEQGDQAIVQRLGRYERTLNPGPNVVIPFLDTVLVETVREQLLDIDPQRAFTKDNVPIEVDAIVSWQILDLQKAYYAVEDLQESLKQIVISTLRNEIGLLTLEQLFSSSAAINKALLRELDQSTANWGVKVIRVEVQEFQISQALRESLEKERAAKAEKAAELTRTQGTVESIQQLAQALQGQMNAEDVLRYLVAKDYVSASMEIGKSDNSKIVFMDPRALSEAVTELMGQVEEPRNRGNLDGEA